MPLPRAQKLNAQGVLTWYEVQPDGSEVVVAEDPAEAASRDNLTAFIAAQAASALAAKKSAARQAAFQKFLLFPANIRLQFVPVWKQVNDYLDLDLWQPAIDLVEAQRAAAVSLGREADLDELKASLVAGLS